MQPLPKDWRQFFETAVSPGTAAFELFELGEQRLKQPVLLIHATPTMAIPRHVALQSRLEIHRTAGIIVVWLRFDIQAASIQPATSTFSIIDDSTRQATRIHIEDNVPFTFETFLNPTSPEDRAILEKLATTPALYVSMIQNGNMLWGKRFPWQEPLRKALSDMLKETEDASPTNEVTWQQAKERVMQEQPL